MPALIADIAAATRDATVATWANATIAARYPSARDGQASPAEGYFDSVADAQAVMNARGGLIGVDGRRRFAVEVADLIWPDLSIGLPQARLIDAEHSVDGPHFAARLQLDLDTETASYEPFG